jgi:hypothetical protein
VRSFLLASAVLAASLASGGAPAEARVVTTQVVKGRLLPPDDTSEAHGTFRMMVQARGEAQREFFYIDAWGLDTTRDGDGNLPSYHAFLINADASTTADFGELYLGPRGRAKLRFHSARESFPSGVATLKDFAGGTVEVRLDATVVLSGDVPDFLGIDDENGPGSHAAARALGVVRLHATDDGGRAKGVLTALYVNRPRVQVEALSVECLRLGKAGDAFTVVAVDGTGGETTLGTLTSRTRFGVGILRLSSRQGDLIPGGGVLALAGRTVEVRDADGVARLTGTFPDLAAE